MKVVETSNRGQMCIFRGLDDWVATYRLSRALEKQTIHWWGFFPRVLPFNRVSSIFYTE